ncbi:hypothetical protein GWI33_001791 [Rhynchophorus ferrugineus]|uniref:Uncharacterized protein n=1 Tax=Rhynchophorus ferrugineus TaxID=354439 RepID=A0A834IN82_RHYFE|nr:hypothetical protein GWI33_001791 [Rhynchophorus ferrugineus]
MENAVSPAFRCVVSSVAEPNCSRILLSVSLNRLKQDGWPLNGNQAAEVLRERKGAGSPKKPPQLGSDLSIVERRNWDVATVCLVHACCSR